MDGLSALFSSPESSSSLTYAGLKLLIPESEGPAAHSLLADQVFNPAFTLAEAIELKDLACPDGAVIEFGSASGLPSLLLASQERAPRLTLLTDHPAVLSVTHRNVSSASRICHSEVKVLPHIWGSQVDDILAANGGELFDLAILSDLLWLKDAAQDLVQSLSRVIKPGGRAWIGAGDYTRQEWIDRFEELLYEAGMGWQELQLTSGWQGTTDITGLLLEDGGISQEIIRGAMARRKQHTRLWIAKML